MTIYIPSPEEIKDYEDRHKLMNDVWQSVLRGRSSPAMIGYKLSPPGKLIDVYFIWSSESRSAEDKAVVELEKLGPRDGFRMTGEGLSYGHWLGVPTYLHQEFHDLEAEARHSEQRSIEEGVKKWHQLIERFQNDFGNEFPNTADAYFGLADLYHEASMNVAHDEAFEQGLAIYERHLNRTPGYFGSHLHKRLIELAHIHLLRDDITSANETYERLKRIKAAVPRHVSRKLPEDWNIFAKYYVRQGKVDEAALAYLSMFGEIDWTRRLTYAEHDALVEAADYLAANKRYSDARQFYEALLDHLLADKIWISCNSTFHWFMGYRTMLAEQGHHEELQRLSDRLAEKEIKAGRRATPTNTFGFVDINGNWQIPARFIKVRNFVNGKASVELGVEGTNNCRKRLIDRLGNDIGPDPNELTLPLPKGYTQREPLHEGMAVIMRAQEESAKLLADKAGTFGYADENGRIVIPAQFSEACPFRNGQAIVAIDGWYGGACRITLQGAKFGVIDQSGNYVITPQFEEIRPFGENYYRYKNTPKSGIVSRTGEIILELDQCFDSFYLDNGAAAVEWGPVQKSGYIDAEGRIIVEPKFDFAFGFKGDFAKVRISDKWGFINRQGELIIEAKYEECNDFADGAAIVQIDGKFGLIDTKGRYLAEPKYDKIESFDDALHCVRPEMKERFIDLLGIESCPSGYEIGKFSGGAIVELSHKKGIIDSSGNLIIPINFADVKPFTEGLAAVATSDAESNASLWGYVDMTGEVVIPARFKEARIFSEGLAAVMDTATGKFGYIDTNGKLVIQPTFDSAADFHSGLAKIGIGTGQDRLFGIINREGTMLIEPEYGFVGLFIEELCPVGRKRIEH